MEKRSLDTLIGNLRKELSAAPNVDPETRDRLLELMTDIEARAEEQDDRDEHESVASRLEESALKIESEHPRLSMAIGELMDALGKLGI